MGASGSTRNSGPTPAAGWDTGRIARAWAELMRRLGYARYGAQGGDVGAGVSPELGRVDPAHVVGVHVNAATGGFMPYPPVDPAELAQLTDVERARVERIDEFMGEHFGYAQIQSTRPQTLAYGLTDSPVGQLAWIADFFFGTRRGEAVDSIDRDRFLTNVMLYWLTGTAGSSGRLYYEDAHAGAWGPAAAKSPAPVGVAVFADDIAIRRYAEPNHNIVHWTDFDRGGHFAALEVPDLLAGDVHAFFRPLR